MGIEIVAGLGAALCWGIFAWIGTVAARRMGGWIVNLGATLFTLVVILPAFPFAWPERLADPGTTAIVILAIAALCVLLADALTFQLLTVAPVALVYPIFASNSAIVVLLAVLILGETLVPLQVLAIVLVAVGIFAIAWRPEERPLRARRRAAALASTVEPGDTPAPAPRRSLGSLFVRPGGGAGRPADQASLAVIAAALGLMVLAAVGVFLGATQIKELGWYPPLLVERGLQSILITGLLVGGHPPAARLREIGRRWWAALLVMGVLNAVAAIFYGLGNQLGSTAVTATITSTFVAVPVILGIVVFRERPARRQVAGIVAALGGTILLGAA